jgi:dinuclear metal center YbgI/SA1388 family protein
MKIREIISAIEESVPLWAQESYDNAGLVVGAADADTDSALLCVDITDAVLDEAQQLGCKLVISHHPIIFHPLKQLIGGNRIQRVVERAIRDNISLYAAHTNLDSIQGGMSYRLAEQLGIGDLELLSINHREEPVTGFGVIGNLQSEMPTEEFMRMMMDRLSLKVVRHNDIQRKNVKRVALCTGAGANLIDTAAVAGADIYVAADFRYNDFLDSEGQITVADIGHFESEYCAIDLLFDIITKKLPTFALHKSVNSRNPVNYKV